LKLTKAQRAAVDAQRMYDALRTIARDYQTPDQLRRTAESGYGLEPGEALEYAYENIQQLAKCAIHGMRRPALSDGAGTREDGTDV